MEKDAAKLAGGRSMIFARGVFFIFLGVDGAEKFFRLTGLHVTPVRPDPTVRRYVARAVSPPRVVRSFGLSQVFTFSSSSLEASKTTL